MSEVLAFVFCRACKLRTPIYPYVQVAVPFPCPRCGWCPREDEDLPMIPGPMFDRPPRTLWQRWAHLTRHHMGKVAIVAAVAGWLFGKLLKWWGV